MRLALLMGYGYLMGWICVVVANRTGVSPMVLSIATMPFAFWVGMQLRRFLGR